MSSWRGLQARKTPPGFWDAIAPKQLAEQQRIQKVTDWSAKSANLRHSNHDANDNQHFQGVIDFIQLIHVPRPAAELNLSTNSAEIIKLVTLVRN